MNLDFGILWVEDSFNPDEEEQLKRRVKESGFIARVENIENGERLDEQARLHRLHHRFDFILLDYRLKNAKGDDLAPIIREKFPATTILFYSGTIDEDALRTLIADKKVEGVFCSSRDRFVDRAGTLIDQTAQSLNRLSGMRGLAMHVVAECDDMLKAAVSSMHARDGECAAKLSDLDSDVDEFLALIGVNYADAKSGALEDRLKSRAVDSGKLFKHFRRLTRIAARKPSEFGLSNDQQERLRELRANTTEYDVEVLGKRNILGHAKEIENEDGWSLSGSGEITVEDFPLLRQSFAMHLDAIREMSSIVCSLDEAK